MKMMSMGSMLATVAAVASPQSVLYWPGIVANPGGIVRVVSLVATINGQRKAPQLVVKV